MSFKIRPYHPSDLNSYYRICLKTGDSGKDGTHLFQDPDLLANYYAAPYAVLEPDICFTLTDDGVPCGYMIGTRDSELFSERCENEWFPPLRVRYPMPAQSDTSDDAEIIRLIHKGHPAYDDLAEYPAHLHIDLLPTAQGQGLGRKLIETFTKRLHELNVPGVHLGVGKENPGGIKFYERTGFHRIKDVPGAVVFGMHL